MSVGNPVQDLTPEDLGAFARIVADSQGNANAVDARKLILDDVLRLFRCQACVTFVWDQAQSRFVDPRYVNVTPSNVRRFEDHFQHVDPWASRVRRLSRPVPLEHVVPTAEFERSRVFKEVLEPDGLYRVLGLYVSDAGTQVGRLSVLRRRDSPEFDNREIELLAVLEPYLVSAFRRRAPEIASLTPRERQVVQLVARGWPDREIGRMLNIAFYTVRTHLANALEKTGCANRTELAAYVATHCPPWRGEMAAAS